MVKYEDIRDQISISNIFHPGPDYWKTDKKDPYHKARLDYYKAKQDLSILEIIELREDLLKSPDRNKVSLEVLAYLLEDRLGMVSRRTVEYMIDQICEGLKPVLSELNEVRSEFKGHQHEIFGAYTSKPRW